MSQSNSLIVATARSTDIVVQESYRIARISDSDLIKEFEGTPCDIIHAPDGSAQFVFLTEQDTQRYFYNQ